MTRAGFIRVVDCELDEPLTVEAVAEAVAAPASLVARLVRMGLIETVPCADGSTLLPTSAVPRLRRMQRLRRDLRVNFAGAAVILDLVERIEYLSRELAEMRRRPGSE
jgi:chaperone modulatory protein CbpM